MISHTNNQNIIVNNFKKLKSMGISFTLYKKHKATCLAAYTLSKDNNFNLIRFIAATLVLISHSFALLYGSSAFEPLKSTLGMTLGQIAVDIFFITSGFLISQSYLNRKSLTQFIFSRLLRIYPALIVAVIFCVFIVGTFFSQHSLTDYFSNLQTLRYLVRNFIVVLGVEHRLPGVFETLPIKNAVNGSLWTLPYELWMYISLVLAYYLANKVSSLSTKITSNNLIVIIFGIAFILNIWYQFYPSILKTYLHLFTMFFCGVTFFLLKNSIILSHKGMLLCIFLLTTLASNQELLRIPYPICLAYLIFYLAYIPTGSVRQFNKFGDYSYGMYIYAFPLQQSIVSLVQNISIGNFVFLSIVSTLALAVLSWHVIEKRALKLKSKLHFRSLFATK